MLTFNEQVFMSEPLRWGSGGCIKSNFLKSINEFFDASFSSSLTGELNNNKLEELLDRFEFMTFRDKVEFRKELAIVGLNSSTYTKVFPLGASKVVDDFKREFVEALRNSELVQFKETCAIMEKKTVKKGGKSMTAIRQRREELGMSLKDLATKAKISRSFLSEVETGKKNIRDFDMLNRLVTTLAKSK